MDKSIMMLILGQVISTVAIIYTNKTEITWIKKIQEQQHERITKLEDRAA